MSDRFAGYECLIKGGFGCSSLWLGDDHLLYVEGYGLLLPVAERYRRYAYTDIDSVVIAPTSVKSLATLWYGVTAALAGVSIAAIIADTGLPGYRWIFTALAAGALVASLLLWVRHLRRGASCICELSTPVSRVRPWPLRRLKTTRVAVEKLKERINSARENSDNGASTAPMLPTLEAPRPVRPKCSVWVVPSFLLHLTWAVWMIFVIALGWNGTGTAVLTSLLAYCALITLSLSLAAATRTPIPIESGMQLWAITVPVTLLGIVALSCYSLFSFRSPELISGSFGFAQMFGSVSTELPNSVTVFLLTLCLALAAFSIAGWRFSSVPLPKGSDTE